MRHEPGFPSGLLWRAAVAPEKGDALCREILDALPAAIYTTDAAGRINYYNEAAADLWGCLPELGTSKWCGSWKLFWPDGRPLPHDECPMALALKEGRAIRGLRAVAERPDGSRVPFMPYPTPIYDATGALVGAVNMLVDLTDRDRAELYEQQLASIVQSADDAIVSKDLNGVITTWNQGAERLFGYTTEEILGKPVTVLIPPERLDEEPEILARVRRGERVEHYETVRRRKDGSLIDISLTISPIRNAEGQIIGASKIARDITERRRAQEQQKLLVSEMKHRIKNTLATVQAFASQTLPSASESERAAFIARLHALGGAHDLLTSENWKSARLGEVVERALAAFTQAYAGRIRIAAASEDIPLSASKSLLLTLALHELATNAVKYGALSNGSGRVDIEWNLAGNDPGRMKFCWRESGGPKVGTPDKTGFGSRLIESALNGDNGETCLEFHPDGVVCTLLMRLN